MSGTYTKGTEGLLLQRTRPRPIPAEYDRPAEGIPPGPATVGALPYLFAVRLVKDGGSSGSKTTKCSFTYTVKDLDGNVMKKNAAGDPATGISPNINTPDIGKMDPPADDSCGFAFWDGTDLVLKNANETLAPQPCL